MLKNKYSKHYKLLMEKAKVRNWNRKSSTNLEKHHILPICFGGKKVVFLTCREHYIAHLLLTKCYTGKQKAKMVHALFRMAMGRQGKKLNISARQYEYIRKIYCEARRVLRLGTTQTQKTKDKISLSNKGKIRTEKSKKEQSEKMMGRYLGIVRGPEFGEKVSRGLNGKYVGENRPWQDKINKNPEKIKKTAAKHRGMKRSIKAKKNMSLAKKGKVPHNKGKKYYYNPITLEKILCYPNEKPKGFQNGFLPK
jgi:hypothetical protein